MTGGPGGAAAGVPGGAAWPRACPAFMLGGAEGMHAFGAVGLGNKIFVGCMHANGAVGLATRFLLGYIK